MEPHPPRVSVIVVNYGTAGLALEAVASVLERTDGTVTLDVHILDNGSPTGDAKQLAEAIAERGWLDRVHLHISSDNLGFGRGNNLVLRALSEPHRRPDFVFLLNPDARLRGPALDHLVGCLLEHPKAGVAGARLHDMDGNASTSAFRFPGLAGEFAEAASFGPITRCLGRWRIPLPAELPSGQVDWVTGAAALVRFDALQQVDFFEPGFFLYYEEVDLMRRLGEAGWECRHVAEAVVDHVEGAATGLRGVEVGQRRRPAYWYQSRRLYFYRSHGRVGAIACALAAISGAGVNHVHSRLRGRRPWIPDRFIRDSWIHMLRPLLTGWTPPQRP
ncbi:glycosyltransferase family 2 protein [Tropicimonas sp. TH_r6]|uniref:glycosyltransferase family 2 protein n=1 Tax=Tropicimonas sp. TH_r6 TaxID=3082085 RepID=UPI0029542290|nr:glycosyltransferase family 2 protein [Tropicimonas sp. TH_r6]MDV7141172.1 glycosyltransferase family 2 protein [Tropicimonas sp. TH_r6]